MWYKGVHVNWRTIRGPQQWPVINLIQPVTMIHRFLLRVHELNTSRRNVEAPGYESNVNEILRDNLSRIDAFTNIV